MVPSYDRPSQTDTGSLLPVDFSPSAWHVLCNRGGECLYHAGNRRFREHVHDMLGRYISTQARQEKMDIVRTVMERVERNIGSSFPGDKGFIKKNLLENRWEIVPDDEVKKKVGQAFRDANKAKKGRKKDTLDQESKEPDSTSSLSPSSPVGGPDVGGMGAPLVPNVVSGEAWIEGRCAIVDRFADIDADETVDIGDGSHGLDDDREWANFGRPSCAEPKCSNEDISNNNNEVACDSNRSSQILPTAQVHHPPMRSHASQNPTRRHSLTPVGVFDSSIWGPPPPDCDISEIAHGLFDD